MQKEQNREKRPGRHVTVVTKCAHLNTRIHILKTEVMFIMETGAKELIGGNEKFVIYP